MTESPAPAKSAVRIVELFGSSPSVRSSDSLTFVVGADVGLEPLA